MSLLFATIYFASIWSGEQRQAGKSRACLFAQTISDNGEAQTDVTAGTPQGTRHLLVSSFECFVSGCDSASSVLRYNAVTGQYQGVHVPSIAGPYGMALRPKTETLLVVSRLDHAVYEYDAQTGAYKGKFISAGAEGLNAPQNIVLASDGNLLLTSTQTENAFNKFNGILKYNGKTGQLVGPFVDGGPVLSESCAHQRCLRGPNGMVLGSNGRLYVASGINNSIIEYNATNGAFVHWFDSSGLTAPIGLTVRPTGTPGAGNLLVTSTQPGTASDLNDSILDFDKTTYEVTSTNNGVFISNMIRPGPIAWHSDGTLLVAERTGHLAPTFSDRIVRRDAQTGAFMGSFTPSTDTHAHFITAMFEVAFGFASDDADADADVDLKDFAAFTQCGSSPNTSCHGIFDDNRTSSIGDPDLLAFLRRFHGPRRPCSTPAQCGDNSPCTVDSCVGGFCSYAAATNGITCADNRFCNGAETCQQGLCTGRSSCIDAAHCNETTDQCLECLTNADCNDNNVCTTDSCSNGTCQRINNTATCDDGNICTVNDRCLTGTCRAGTARNCSDGNVCTDDSCDQKLGCLNVDNLVPCDDGNACTLDDQCLQGTCRRGSFRNCNDNNSCTTDTCDALAGCQHTNNTGTCDDGNACTTGDACAAGTCRGTQMNCADSVPCTHDVCVNGTCQHNLDHSVCDNGLYCDGSETCHATLGCRPGTAVNCNDGISCTTDTCDEKNTECDHVPVASACNDGLFCNGVETCDINLGCRPGTAPNCADAFACTDDSCNEANDTCVHTDNNSRCTDSNGCTTDTCVSGVCTFTNNTASCNDGLFCTLTDVCSGGSCSGSGARCPGQQCNETTDACVQCLNATHCDDSNVCTDNPCVSGVCQISNNLATCNDGLFCTTTDRCAGGSCVGSGNACPGQQCNESTDACVECLTVAQCNDNNICTTDSCAGGACQHVNNTVSCDDGLFCTATDACAGGSCQGSGVRCPGQQCNEDTNACVQCLNAGHCNDNNVCTNDSCASGSCQNVNNAVTCNDGLFCTLTDVCAGGSCGGSGTPCAAGLCNENTDACVECLNNGNCNDGNPCTTDTCVSGTCSRQNNTVACDDGLFCTVSDTCANGVCVGQNRCPEFCNENSDQCVECLEHGHCDDGNVCTTDQCVNGTCANNNNTISCDDGLFCTLGDVCANGACAGQPTNCSGGHCDELGNRCVDCLNDAHCNDGNLCTDDSCVDGGCQTENNSDACDDGDFCTAVDTCSGGSCVGEGDSCPGQLCDESSDACVDCLGDSDCADTNECTTDRCVSGGCQNNANTLSCDDLLFCTVEDRCAGGVCSGVPAGCPGEYCDEDNDRCVECLVDGHCDDDNGCTDDFCVNGDCEFSNNTADCNDGRFCTAFDQCAGGGCVGGGDACPGAMCDEAANECVECLSSDDCEDGNPCTDDDCVVGNCVFPDNSASCDDGNFCTNTDVCSGGNCIGSGDPCPGQFCTESAGCVDCLIDSHCEDGNICTDDVCDGGVCEFPNNSESCDDGLFCTEIDTCFNGNCTGTGDPCQAGDETCDENLDSCVPNAP